MNVPKPNPERFDMSIEECMAFWMIIIREYSHKEVRSQSLEIYRNKPLVESGDSDAG